MANRLTWTNEPGPLNHTLSDFNGRFAHNHAPLGQDRSCSVDGPGTHALRRCHAFRPSSSPLRQRQGGHHAHGPHRTADGDGEFQPGGGEHAPEHVAKRQAHDRRSELIPGGKRAPVVGVWRAPGALRFLQWSPWRSLSQAVSFVVWFTSPWPRQPQTVSLPV